MEPSPLGEGGRRPDEGQVSCGCPFAGPRQTLRPHQSAGGAADSFPRGGSPGCRKRCAHPLAPSARGLRPQAVGERTVRLPEIFRAQFVKEPHHQAAQQPSAASKIQKYFPKACKQRRFHAQFASFFRFMAANLSLTHCVTRVRPLMWV